MNYQAVFFDFDGTLVHSLNLWARAFKVTFEGYGISMSEEEVVTRCFYRPWEDVAIEFGAPSPEAFSADILKNLRKVFLDAELFPSAIDLLKHCKAHGLQTALVTSSPSGVLYEVLPRLGLSEYFDFVISGDEVAHHKPHPEPLLRALEALGRKPHEVLMVGDSKADIFGGKAAGTATALFLPDVHRPYYCFDTLRATLPDHVAKDYNELIRALGLPSLTFAEIPALERTAVGE